MIGTFLYIIYSRVYTTIYVVEPKNFKDNLKTNEAGFGKKLRTTEARFDFTGPYKTNKVYMRSNPGNICSLEKGPYNRLAPNDQILREPFNNGNDRV